ncbi:MAG TPA: CAP domain-containing protein [Gaiellaceae bacterium]|jgi:uncharacterized protein YkwD
MTNQPQVKRAILLVALAAATVVVALPARARAADPLLAPVTACGDPSATASLVPRHRTLPGPRPLPHWYAAWQAWRLAGHGNRPASAPRKIPGWARARLKIYKATHRKVPSTQLASMLCYHNWAREHNGLKPLGYSKALAAFSAQKSAKIVQCGVFTHAPCGENPFQGFPAGFSYEGENLVMMGPVGTVRQMFALWLGSAGHRANILNPSFTQLGLHLYIGAAFGQSGVMMWCADFGG